VTLDRSLRERSANDGAFRRKLEADRRPTRSSADRMSDTELLEKLNSMGFPLDRQGVARICEGVLSVQDAAQPLIRDWEARNPGNSFMVDWIWISLLALWQRWWPDKVCMELLDDKMQAGYAHQENGDITTCAAVWLDTWADVLRLCDAAGIGSIDEFDNRFPLTQSLFNWMSDFEMELSNAGVQDPGFHTDLIGMCEEALGRFGDMDPLNAGNMRRAWADSLFRVGRAAEGNELFESWLAADPRWGWGWIGWADCYTPSWCADGLEDVSRAEELLRRGYEQPGVRDRADIADRLAWLYKDTDRPDKARKWFAPGHGAGAAVVRVPVARAEGVERNAPCPCGSGRKYKRCCGSPR
jgi:hypothetical protein